MFGQKYQVRNAVKMTKCDEILQSLKIFTDFLHKRFGQSDRHLKNFCQCLCKYLMFSHVIVLHYNEIKSDIALIIRRLKSFSYQRPPFKLQNFQN